MRKVQFYYDVISPYSWLAFEVFCRYKSAWSIDLELCPFFLGGVMNQTGNRGPTLLQAKAPYMLKDLVRQSRYYQVSVKMPCDMLANTILPMRVLTIIKEEKPHYLGRLSRILWERHYGLGLEISSPEAVSECLKKVEIPQNDAVYLLKKASAQQVKDKLRQTTQQAIDQGAFGAPTFFVENHKGEMEMFFGSDRFHLVAEMLGQKWLGPNPV